MATFYNQAPLSYNGNTTTSNITTGELVEVLSAKKHAILPDYVAGDNTTGEFASVAGQITAPTAS